MVVYIVLEASGYSVVSLDGPCCAGVILTVLLS